jgi:exonuclease III
VSIIFSIYHSFNRHIKFFKLHFLRNNISAASFLSVPTSRRVGRKFSTPFILSFGYFSLISPVFAVVMFHSSFTVVSFIALYFLLHSSPVSSDSSQTHPSFATPTASIQFSHLNVIPLSFFFASQRPKAIPVTSLSCLLLILLSGDIQLNPGPTSNTFNVCSLNIRSLLNPIHYTAIADLAHSHHIHLFALTETWVTPSTTHAELQDSIPSGFSLISTPRLSASSNKSHVIGGGTAFLIRDPCTILPSPTRIFKSFEFSSTILKLHGTKLAIFNVYRPPASTKTRSSVPMSQFFKDLNTLISIAATTPHEFLITGDFNLHLDDLSDSNTKQFLSILNAANLTQHVHFPTHNHQHTLDLVITHSDSTLSPKVTFSPVSPSDHYPLFTSLTIEPLTTPLSVHSFRCINSINTTEFIHEIAISRLITHPPSTLTELIHSYNLTLSDILNKHAPLRTKTIKLKPSQPWFTPTLSKLKSFRRHLERLWSRTHSAADLKLLRSTTNHYHAAIIRAKKLYNSNLISSNISQPRKLWNSVNKILHRKSANSVPNSIPPTSLPEVFATFFSDKIHKLRFNLHSNTGHVSPHIAPTHSPSIISQFSAVTCEEVTKLISESSDTYCDLDPIPTSLLKKCSSVLVPTITNIMNLSLSTGICPDQFKSSLVLPHLKKSTLNKEELANYRPISHLSFLSKLSERIVKNRLTHHLSSNTLLNSFQSAYAKFHSTETTLLAVHDHIINSISQQKVTALCLLDLSAAFDTIDHSILIQRLSAWFGFNGKVLSWIESYLCPRSFKVRLNGSESSIYQLLYGVPQGSVLGPLLFTLYTTPLSSLITHSTVNHHLYADDTQLFVSFSSPTFATNILHLQNTISNVSDWMSSNMLSLNHSKTEFLLIGLPKQLSKISDPVIHMPSDVSISPVSSARNLGVIFDSTLSMSEHISAISKSCFFHIRDLRRIRNTLDLHTTKTIATSLIHSRLDYCNSLFLNLPSTQLNRLQLLLNSTARITTKTPKFHHISPTLKSLHWLKINQRIEYKVISLTYKTLQSQQPKYLRSLLTVNTGSNTRSSSALTLLRPPNISRLKITDRSFLHHAPVLWNKLPPEMRQLNIPTLSQAALSTPLLALSSSQFHNRLKTYLFHQSYPP